MTARLFVQWAALFAIAIVCHFSIAADETKSRPKVSAVEIPAEGIGRDVFIRGRLGKRLGEFMSVVGQWVLYRDDKHGRWVFCVMEVDGDQLANPIAFGNVSSSSESGLKLKAGEIWSLRCYENATFAGLPDKYRSESPDRGGSGGNKWEFRSELHYVKREVRQGRDLIE